MMNSPKKNNDIRFAFFGTAPLKEGVLQELEKNSFVPEKIIESTALTQAHIDELKKTSWDVFIVASYGKKIPEEVLSIPKHGTINVHPSLLPRLRGPSPIRSTILHDVRETGVSIMLLDDKLDHGPLIAQKKIIVDPWPPHGPTLDTLLAHEGGTLLAAVLSPWLNDEIEARPQNDDLATYCEEFKKENGFLDLRADPYQNLLKIRAFEGWPGTYTFFERGGKKIRVGIIDAHLEGNTLSVDIVKPEGKREMPYEEFLHSGAKLIP